MDNLPVILEDEMLLSTLLRASLEAKKQGFGGLSLKAIDQLGFDLNQDELELLMQALDALTSQGKTKRWVSILVKLFPTFWRIYRSSKGK